MPPHLALPLGGRCALDGSSFGYPAPHGGRVDTAGVFPG